MSDPWPSDLAHVLLQGILGDLLQLCCWEMVVDPNETLSTGAAQDESRRLRLTTLKTGGYFFSDEIDSGDRTFREKNAAVLRNSAVGR